MSNVAPCFVIPLELVLAFVCSVAVVVIFAAADAVIWHGMTQQVPQCPSGDIQLHVAALQMRRVFCLNIKGVLALVVQAHVAKRVVYLQLPQNTAYQLQE